MFFKNRKEAGIKLAKKLQQYKNAKNTLILALPRGGVIIGYELAKSLSLPLNILISKKISHPYSPELAIGAVTENKVVEVDPLFAQEYLQYIMEQKEKISGESKRRRKQFTTHSFPQVEGKTIILTDDGIATGLTMIAAIHDLRKRGVKKIIVVVPVVPKDSVDQIRNLVDDFQALLIDEPFFGGIGAYYVDFDQVSDDAVTELLKNIQDQS